MAKIELLINDEDNVNNLDLEKIGGFYAEALSGMLDVIDGGDGDLIVNAKKNGVVIISGTGRGIEFQRVISKDHINHSFFELGSGLQGKGLNKYLANASVEVAAHLNIKSITLDANLDIGGYAWLRKGYLPDAELWDLFIDDLWSKHGQDADLLSRYILKTKGLNRKQIQLFHLSPEFKEYKKVFLDSYWTGDANPLDEITRLAMVDGAEVAFAAAQKPEINRTKIPVKTKPKTSNEEILDSYIRHQTYILRYGAGLTNKAYPNIIATERELEALVLRYATKLEGNALVGTRARKELAKFATELTELRGQAWNNVDSLVVEELNAFAIIEAQTASTIITEAMPVILNFKMPPKTQFRAIVEATPFEGRVLGEWLERTEDLDISRISKALKTGIIQGDTPTQVTRRVMGTKAQGRRDGVCRKSFNDLESVILTANSSIQNDAKSALYEENSDIVSRETFVATLDGNTTYECANYDDQTFKIGEGPKPPLHFRCRSLRVVYANPDDMTNRPMKPVTEKMLLKEFTDSNNLGNVTSRKSLPRGYKTKFDNYSRKRTRELVGTVPAKTSFNNWISRQTVEFQDEYFGPTRAAMFRDGNLTVGSFVSRSGDPLTLDQLKRKGFDVPDL